MTKPDNEKDSDELNSKVRRKMGVTVKVQGICEKEFCVLLATAVH